MCAEMEFSQGRRSARGAVRFAGQVVVGSIFVLVVAGVCVCLLVEAKWSCGLEAAERFMPE